MASALSDDEFNRMQEQLIELRTTNYSLEEVKRKQSYEIKTLQDKVSNLQDDVNKAHKTISKSKKLKEIESIIQENESLMNKLQCQEDEFRLQNSTIMQELSSLISANEKLEKEVNNSKANISESSSQPELMRLQAENTILQKNLLESSSRNEAKIENLEKKIIALKEGLPEESADDISSFDVADTKTNDSEKLDSKMKFEVIEEENRILQEQLDSLNKTFSESQTDITKLNEKLKKKQESILQLQQEKEAMYKDNLKSLEDSAKSRNEEITQLKDMTCRLQTQLKNSLDSNQESKAKSVKLISDLEIKCEQLQSQINDLKSSDPEKLKVLEEEMLKLKSSAEKAWVERDNQVRALKEALSNNEVQLQTIKLLEKAKLEAENNERDSAKLAEKRKCLLDEMAIHLQSETDKHLKELNSKTTELNSEITELRDLLESEKEKNVKMHKLKEKVNMLSEEVKSLESSKGWLERQLKEVESEAVLCKEGFEKEKVKINEENKDKLSELASIHEEDIKDLNVQIELIKVQKAEFEETVLRLKQEAKDSVEDQKLREKKRIGIVKDLKRQLHSERRQVEKLQERIQELLSETNHSRLGVDELLTGSQSQKRGDNGSVGSWSLMSGGTPDNSNLGRDSSSHNGHDVLVNDPPEKLGPSNLEQEHHDLIERLAQVQQEKWNLEEKLDHLEISNSAMVEDIMAKSLIIQHYCMEGRPDPQHHHSSTDKLTVKRVVDFIKDKGDENLRDINRKLQRMLEETLTKNMHLQKNLESLSNELSSKSDHTSSKS